MTSACVMWGDAIVHGYHHFIKLYNRNNLIDVKKSVLSNCNEKE